MLSFAFYLLSQNPEVEKKAMAEIDAVLGRDPSVPIEWKHIAQLKYIDLVIKETLRLYPTAPAFAKQAMVDVKYGDYFIPKGTGVIVLLWGLHRNPKVS